MTAEIVVPAAVDEIKKPGFGPKHPPKESSISADAASFKGRLFFNFIDHSLTYMKKLDENRERYCFLDYGWSDAGAAPPISIPTGGIPPS